MPLLRPIDRLRRVTARLPRAVCYGIAAGFVGLGVGLRHLAEWLSDWPSPVSFLFLTFSIAASAALNRGSGYLATLLAALVTMPYLPASPEGFVRADWLLPLSAFMVLGTGLSALVESLIHALRDRETALRASQDASRRRELLLIEYRHRSRGDLQAVASLLRLRMRGVADPGAKAALAEAAGHTVALGRIHSRMEMARHDVDEVAMVDAGEFVRGVAADMTPPVTNAAGASRMLTTDRAVGLGLLVCELVADARRDEAGVVSVRLMVLEPDFILDVIDDRHEATETDGMRARLVTLLAGQLRGAVSRQTNCSGVGLTTTVKFPVAAPNLNPGQVGKVTTT